MSRIDTTARGQVRLFAVPVLAAAVAVGGCRSGEAGETVTDASDVAPVQRLTLDIRAEAAGLVEPIRVVEVKSKASGEILRLMVETGDDVERGALLAEVDPRDVRNGLAQAEADLEVARARLGTARAQRDRTEELRKANVATEQELEGALMEAANARAQLVKAETNLQLARERMNDVTIRAPIGGTVIQKTVEAGQIIASASGNVSGGTTLMLMADLSEMQVRTLIDETDIGRIEAGQTARVSVEAYPNRAFVGSVYKIEPQAVVEQNVTMFPVLVRLDNSERLLRPGMNAEVQVEIARRENVLAVPNAAIVSVQDVAAAAGALGLDPESVRAGMGGRFTGARGGARESASEGRQIAMAERAEGEVAGAAASHRAAASAAGADGAAAREHRTQADSAGGAPDGEEPRCAAIRQKFATGGRDSLSEEERRLARSCMQAARGGGQREAAGNARPGFVFVAGANGPEPRRVMLGLNDWEHTEVVSGLEDGAQVYLISVARLQQQQQQMVERIRERQNPFGGGGGRGR